MRKAHQCLFRNGNRILIMISNWWNNLTETKKKVLILAAICDCVIIATLLIYFL